MENRIGKPICWLLGMVTICILLSWDWPVKEVISKTKKDKISLIIQLKVKNKTERGTTIPRSA
jgi:hypothetical protein